MTAPRRRWAFLGSDAIALPVLRRLADDPRAELAAVWTQPDRPSGRGQKLASGPIKAWALERGAPVFQPERLGDADVALVRELGIELLLVMAYGQILRQTMLDAPALGCFNLHTSRLPAYRGASPIQTAVACGERETSVTLMRIVLELDAGPVVDHEPVPIAPEATALDVETLLSAACVPLLERNWPAMLAGASVAVPQDPSRVTFCRRLEKTDGALDFTRPATELAARVNGLFPWPACQVDAAGTPVKFGRATALAGGSRGAPGAVLGPVDGRLAIACGEGVLLVHELQRPGGRMLGAEEFLRGFRFPEGCVLPSRPMAPLVDTKPFPWKPRR